jgi:OOP family OmpA-OmpF porin
MRTSKLFRNTLAVVAVGGGIALAPADSRAQTDPATGFYAGGSIGRSDLTDGCSAPGAVVTNCDTRDTAWKAYGGYQINKWLGAEVGYVDFGNGTFGGTLGGAPFTSKTETWGITAHAVGQIPIPLDNEFLNKISILGKVGTVRWDQDRSSSLAALSGNETGWAFGWGLGLQYTFNEHLGVRAEWEQFNNVGSGATGESDIQMWTVGLNYKF